MASERARRRQSERVSTVEGRQSMYKSGESVRGQRLTVKRGDDILYCPSDCLLFGLFQVVFWAFGMKFESNSA